LKNLAGRNESRVVFSYSPETVFVHVHDRFAWILKRQVNHHTAFEYSVSLVSYFCGS
jgi:hypothetical protein